MHSNQAGDHLGARKLTGWSDGSLCFKMLSVTFLSHQEKKQVMDLSFVHPNSVSRDEKCVGLARTIYIRCVNGILGKEITIYTVIYGVYIRFWPTLKMC